MAIDPSAIRSFAEQIQRAYETREMMRPLTVTHPDITLEDSYAVQSAWVEMRCGRGSRVVGHKIGLTSKAMQSMSFVNEPDYGVLLDDSLYQDGIDIPAGTYLWQFNPAARAGSDEAAIVESGKREIGYMMEGYRSYTDGQKDFGRVDRAGFTQYMQMFKDEGLLKEIPPIEDLVTDQFIECANKIDAAAVRRKARDWKG